MGEKIQIHNRDVAPRIQGLSDWKIPDSEREGLKTFLEQLGLGRVHKGVRISESRQCKYLDVLRTPLEFFNKPTEMLTLVEVEAFEKALGSGGIHSSKGRAYSSATKVDMRRALKVYFRWKLGTPKANELTDWLDTRNVTTTPDFIAESDVEKLYKACSSAEERFLVAVLFDSGARASEFHNIRYEDIFLPQGDKHYVKIALKEEYSKTKGRTVSLFWKNSEEAVREYIRERERDGIRRQDPIFNGTYTAARFFLQRMGRKILGRSIHYHLFRHSSATYYADKMNRQQLCVRYGWTFSSDMPDVYISRAGVDNAELDKKFAGAEISEVKDQLTKAKQRENAKDLRIESLERQDVEKEARIQRLERVINEVKLNFDLLNAALKKGATNTQVLEELNGRTPQRRM